MTELRAVQLNDRASEDTALYFTGLRPDQILYVDPCAGMPVDKIMEITGGQRTVIVGDIREPMQMRRPNNASTATRNSAPSTPFQTYAG